MASTGFNRQEFIGYLGQDPERRSMPSGDSVVNFSVASTESWKGANGPGEHTEWFRCVAYKGLANVIAEYMKKGSFVYIAGPTRTRTWKDAQGNDRQTTEIIVRDFKMLDRRPPGQAASNQEEPPSPTDVPGGVDDFDDDIPF